MRPIEAGPCIWTNGHRLKIDLKKNIGYVQWDNAVIEHFNRKLEHTHKNYILEKEQNRNFRAKASNNKDQELSRWV